MYKTKEIKMKNIAIIGSGSWGVALATYLSGKGNMVKIWSFNEEEKKMINEEKRCKFLPQVVIPDNIECLTNFEEVIKNAEFILHVTPSKFTRETFKKYKQYVGNKPVIICSKGFEKETLKTLDEVIKEELPTVKIGVLSGPSHAEEVSIGIPTVLVVASKHDDVLELIQDTFTSEKMTSSESCLGFPNGGVIHTMARTLFTSFCRSFQYGIKIKCNNYIILFSLDDFKEKNKTVVGQTLPSFPHLFS